MPPESTRRRVRRRWLWLPTSLFILLALGVLGYCSERRHGPVANLTLHAPRPVVWKDFLGVNAHFLWFEPAVYRKQMDRLQALGLQWVRIDLHWDRIEPKAGTFRWDVLDPLMQQLHQRHLQAEIYLVGSAPFATSAPTGAPHPDQYPPRDPASYAQALSQLAIRYPQVAAWQVWNEPNLPAFWYPSEDPAGYGRLLLASVQALRHDAPGRQIVLGGMAYYSQMPRHRNALMIEALGNGGLFTLGTVIAYHPYSLQPEGDDPATRDFILRAQQGNRSLRAAGVKQIWADEWGWSSYAGPKEEQAIIGESGQADYLLRRLALMSALDYDRTFLFALSDLDERASVRDRSYGLLSRNADPKPAYAALARFLAITGPQLTPDEPPATDAAPIGLISIAWRRGDGRHLWMFWATQPAQLHLKGIAAATLHNPLEGSRRALQASAATLTVPVANHLQILEWP